MKRTILKQALSLVLVLCLIVPYPGFLLAAGSKDAASLESLAQYEETTRTKDLEIFQRYLDRAGREWEAVYQELWRARHMDESLKNKTTAAVDASIEKTDWTDKIKGFWDEKVIGKVLEQSVEQAQESFSSDYRDFLNGLDKPYSDRLAKLMIDFARELSEARREAVGSLPGFQVLLDRSLNPAVAQIQQKYVVPDMDSPVKAGGFKEGAVGVGVLAIRKALQKKIAENMMKRLLGAAARKVIFVFEGPLGWTIGVGLIGYDVYAIGKEIQAVPEKLKTGIFDSMRSLFFTQAPKTVWEEGLKEQVQGQLRSVKELVSGSFDAAVKEFMACPAYHEVAAGLQQEEQNQLVMKLYLLRSNTSVSLCKLMEQFGPVLTQVGTQQLDCLQRGLKSYGTELMKRWIDLSPQKICVVTEISPDQLMRYEPTAENLSILLWISELPESVRPMAFGLDQTTTRWIRGNLTSTKQVQLFKGKTKEQVLLEVEKLRSPPPEKKAVSEPAGWLGTLESQLKRLIDWSGPWDEYRWIFVSVTALVVLVIVVRIGLFFSRLGVFRFIGRVFRSRKV